MQTHDVIIVGASVAGCRTALTLAEAGVRVLMLDRATFPRWKPCAGGLTLKARPYLPAPLLDQVECTVTGAHFTFGDEYETQLTSAEPLGWMVHRERFDAAHLELARSRPEVEVALGVTVRGLEEHAGGVRLATSRGEMEARAVVGADGAKSVISRHIPGHRERLVVFAYEGEAGPLTEDLTTEAVFDFRRFSPGYGWVFPKEDHYSVGGFVFGPSLPGIKGLYREFCREQAALRGARTYRTRGHPIVLGGSLRPLNTRRVLLAGEAAELVDPLTGEGIYYALRSGHLAGESVAAFLDHGTPLVRYTEAVREEIQDDLRYGRILAEIFYSHPRASFHLVFRNSLMCEWFTRVRSGMMSYAELMADALLKGLVLPFHTGLKRRQVVQVG